MNGQQNVSAIRKQWPRALHVCECVDEAVCLPYLRAALPHLGTHLSKLSYQVKHRGLKSFLFMLLKRLIQDHAAAIRKSREDPRCRG